MNKFSLFAAAALLSAAAIGAEFPLEFKSLTAEEALVFVGGTGVYGRAASAKPSSLRNEPAAVSRHPLYGQLFCSSDTQRVFRIDESKGDGKGYDQLLIDMNLNGDLTDEAAASATPDISQPRLNFQQRKLFGPILAPADKKIAGQRPFYFAQLFLYSTSPGQSPARYEGQLLMKPGWYLEAQAELSGVKRKVGFSDGNCNFHIGDVAAPVCYNNAGHTNWYFPNGDIFLNDADNSGAFEYSASQSETLPYFSMVCLGGQPCKIALAPECNSVTVTPWSEPLADFSIEPNGKQVASLQLALEHQTNSWQLFQANITNGHARVPPGKYRLYSCTVRTESGSNILILNGYKSIAEGETLAVAGIETPFRCGSPFEVKVSAQRNRNSGLVIGESNTLLGRLLGLGGSAPDSLEERIDATLTGAGGETYSSFSQINAGVFSQPPSPVFTIKTTDGQQVATGKMEYG